MTINYNLDELNKVAKDVLKHAKSKYILFSGEMGTGKTTLIKELVSTLGSKDKVSSPTFSLVNEYEGDKHSIFHFDFYRIEDEIEAYDIGFEDYLNTRHFVFIEWPEKIPNLWPEHYTLIKIDANQQDYRRLSLTEF
jgi:tRNA threonylcarbamoyladenosine biosynthesis protein TsaE